jgi:lipoic acid synthetase
MTDRGDGAPLRRSLIRPDEADRYKWNDRGRGATVAGGDATGGAGGAEAADGVDAPGSTASSAGVNIPGRRPEWLKAPLPGGATYGDMKELVKGLRLNTVCQSANCPNIGECWNERHVTLMIMGHTCTRSCGFCDVLTGRPGALDAGEPARVAEAVRVMGLDHVVVTSVNRDDLDDGGAAHWAATIEAVRREAPEVTIEVLVPDFQGETRDVDTVLAARPHVYAHNLETVRRLQRAVRPQASYGTSLMTLRHAAATGTIVKSGLMAGLGETEEELQEALRDLKSAGVTLVTIGQYLQPSPKHLPVERWVRPEEFVRLKTYGESLGLEHVEAGPLVRSSYRAGGQVRALLAARRKEISA